MGKNRFVKVGLGVLLCLSTLGHTSYTVVHDQVKEKIKSKSLQNVQRLKIKLDNGLEAFLISDPSAKKSGAALSVAVGQFHEPFDKIGMAHFVEHMLFMGTAKYPDEHEYQDFMTENGGLVNAYTAGDQTVYIFQVNNAQMNEALDRFSSFFTEPLFNESGLSRERKAVNQEFLMRANSDGLRQHLVQVEFMNENSPLHAWRCGTEETLKAVSRDELVTWYQNNYSANIMKLVVYSALPMQELVTVVDQSFSLIPNRQIEKTNLTAPNFNSASLGQWVYSEPIKDVKQLAIVWELPSEFAVDLENHTADIVSAALGDESQNSLSRILKDKGYINTLQTGLDLTDHETSFFEMHYDLTEKGLKNVSEVVGLTYEAINTFKATGIPRYCFDEKVKMAKLNYQYQSRPEAVFDYVSTMAHKSQYEKLATFPSQTAWPTTFNQAKIQEFLSCLTPNAAFYQVMAPEASINKTFDRKEKDMGVRYTIEPISASQLQNWAHLKAQSQIKIAPPNPYIPNDLELVTENVSFDPTVQAKLYAQNAKESIYYAVDKEFFQPEAYCSLYLTTPSFGVSANDRVLADLYLLSIQDALVGVMEQGGKAGLSAQLTLSPKFGWGINVSGYSQKLELYLKEIVDESKNHKPNLEKFNLFKEQLARAYANQQKEAPYKHAADTMNSLILKDYVDAANMAAALQKIDYQFFKNFCEKLYNEVYIRAMFYGNITEKNVEQLTTHLNQIFKNSSPYELSRQPKREVLDLSANSLPRYFSKNIDQMGSSTYLMISYGQLDHSKRAAFEILSRAIKEPFFDTIRTKQQIGYLVRATPAEYEKFLFTGFIVQSNSCSPRDILARFELFNEQFLATLGTEEFSKDKFDAVKRSLITEYLQPPVSIEAKGAELSSLAFFYEDFKWKEQCVAALNELSFDQFVQFSKEKLGKTNNKRIAVLVEGQMPTGQVIEYVPINNVETFKAESYYSSEKKSVEELNGKINP